MNTFKQTNGPATLNDSDLRTPNGNCPCAESLCDCCVQIETKLRQIREESSLLKQQLEALSINHEMRSAAVVATLLNWIDDDAAKLKMKSCCCRVREPWQRSRHMAEGSFNGPVLHSTPVNKSAGIPFPEIKRDTAASHVESVRFVTPSIAPMDSSGNSSFMHGVSAGSSNVFTDSNYRSSTLYNGDHPPSLENGASQVFSNRVNGLPPNSRISNEGSFRLCDLDSSIMSNAISDSLSNKTSSSIRTLDLQELSSTNRPTKLSGDARTPSKNSNTVNKESQPDKPSSEADPVFNFPQQVNQDSLLRSSSAPPEGPRPNINPTAFHSQPLQTYARTGMTLSPASDPSSSAKSSYKGSQTSTQSQRSAVPPTISEIPRNPTSVHQPLPVKPDSNLYNLQQSTYVTNFQNPSDQVRSSDKPDLSDSSLGVSPNASSSSACGGHTPYGWYPGKTYSGQLKTPNSSGQSSVASNDFVTGGPNSRPFCSNSNNVKGDTAGNETQESEKVAARKLLNDCKTDGLDAALVGTTENVQRSPSRSPQTVQSEFGSVTEIEDFVTKLISNRRLLGEVAFQLDRRILNYVFNSKRDKKRFYGYTIQNILEKIARESEDQFTGQRDERKYALLYYRYEYVQNMLRPHGYNVKRHSETSEILVNCFGLLPTPSNKMLQYHFIPSNSQSVWAILEKVCPPSVLPDVGILFNCLLQFSKDDGKPMIMW